MGVTVITGTSTGIGLAAAVYFAGKGNDVVATMRDPSKSDALEKAAEAAGVSVDIRQLDVDDPASISACISSVLTDKGRIDLLINNAGIASMNPWEEASMDEVEQHFTTNFFGAVRCAKAVIPAMRAQGSGAIVNVSSIAARLDTPVQGPYSATKAALASFTGSLALELRPHGIKVLNVMPGFTATPILDKAFEGRTALPGDPYGPIVGRWTALYAHAKQVAAPPEVVAEAIEAMLATDDTIHRPSGPDGQPFLDNIAKLSDADWLKYGDPQTDEEWFGRFMTDFPMN